MKPNAGTLVNEPESNKIWAASWENLLLAYAKTKVQIYQPRTWSGVISGLFSLYSPVCGGPGPEVIKLFSCSTQLSMKFELLSNNNTAKISGIFRFESPKTFILLINVKILTIYEQDKFQAQLSWAWKKFYNLGAWSQTQLILNSLIMSKPMYIPVLL